MKRRLWWSLPTALCSLWPWTLQLSGHPCKSPFLWIQFLNCKILNDLRCCQRCSCWTEVQSRAVVWLPRNRCPPIQARVSVCVLSARNVSWVLWPNFAWNSVLGALELACPREMPSTVLGPTGGNEMSQRASLQMPLGLWHASWLRTTAVFTDEVHLYKYSVFLPDKNNYCPYWSIWHSMQKPSLK